MNVLHITSHLNTGGITTYILKLAKPLRERGIYLWVLSGGGEWTQRFRDEGIPCCEMNIKTKSELNPKIYAAIPSILKLIRSQNIDLLHAHTRVTQVMAQWISLFSGKKVITTCHGFYKKRLGRILFPAWGHKIIAISQGVAEGLGIDFGVRPDQIEVICNGVNFNELEHNYAKQNTLERRRQYGIQPTDFVIGVIARLVEDKGHEYLIRAVHKVSSIHPHIKLLIVGEGRSREFLSKLAEELGLIDQVIFTGNVPDVTVPLCCIDLFVLPATWREGFGLSIVEAMACRKPIIVTNIWALNSLIQHRETGVMVEPKDIEGLSSSILEMIENSEFRLQMAEAGHLMAKRLFSIDIMADKIAQLYHRMAAPSGILP